MPPPPPSAARAPCVSPTQYSASWPGAPRKVPVAPPACVRHHPAQPLLPAYHPPSTAFRGPIRSSTE
eukprot:5086085-Pyramimonas_sp.AAC.1